MRARRTPLVIAAVALFLVVSFLTTRYLSADTRERNLIIALLSAQARGDGAEMVRRLDGCAELPRCVAQTQALAQRLRRPGLIRIARYDSETVHSLGAARGPTRVVWITAGHGLTVVQCVDVQRTGNALRGRSIRLRALSAPIQRLSSCPGQTNGL